MRGILLLFLLILSFGILTYKFSFALMSSSAASGSNSFSAAAEFAASPSPTPTLSPTPSEQTVNPGGVIINEINWGGSSISTADEWIELRNITNNAIDVSGWTIENLGESNSPIITIHDNKIIPANGFFILSNYSKANSILNIDPDDINAGISLSNNASELLILRSGSAIIDSAGQATGQWFAGENSTPGPAKSMERKDPAGDGTISTNWETANSQANLDSVVSELATPGGAN